MTFSESVTKIVYSVYIHISISPSSRPCPGQAIGYWSLTPAAQGRGQGYSPDGVVVIHGDTEQSLVKSLWQSRAFTGTVMTRCP